MSAPLFMGNASNSSHRAGRALRACVHTSGRCGRSRCPPSLEPFITCPGSGAGRPGPPWSLPMDAHPPDTDSDHPADRGCEDPWHLAVKPRTPSAAWPPRGPHPRPHTGEMGTRVPCPPVGPDGLQRCTPWKQISPPQLPVIHALNTPADWQTLHLSFLPIKSPRAACV